jgi:hypothetical protein
MQPQIVLPDRKTDAKRWLSEVATDVMPAIKPVEIPAIPKAWSPAAPVPRDKPWTRRITHAGAMRIIWTIFEIALFSIILAKILLEVVYH